MPLPDLPRDARYQAMAMPAQSTGNRTRLCKRRRQSAPRRKGRAAPHRASRWRAQRHPRPRRSRSFADARPRGSGHARRAVAGIASLMLAPPAPPSGQRPRPPESVLTRAYSPSSAVTRTCFAHDGYQRLSGETSSSGFETSSDRLPSPENAGAHRADRAIHDLCDFLVTQAFNLAQDNGRTQFLGRDSMAALTVSPICFE